MNQTLIIVPTVNERENLPRVAEKLLSLPVGVDMLVIDGNSSDGTGKVADELAAKHPEIHVIHEQKKSGLCDPSGEWAGAFKKTVENFAQSGNAPSTATPAPAGSGAAAPPPPPPAPAAQSKLTGLDAGKAILGNTISGRRDNEDYADYYSPDGKLTALSGGEIELGRWTLEGDLLCTDFPSEGKICYRVDVLGETVTFIDKDGTGFRGTILKGNPKNL